MALALPGLGVAGVGFGSIAGRIAITLFVMTVTDFPP
jgi:hypothetical protein